MAMILGTIALVAVVIGWMYFCYKNPGTASLMYLISLLLGSE